MNPATLNQTIALGGLFQALQLVKQVAWKGAADPDALRSSLQSLFKLDARDTLDVFGGQRGVALGLEVLRAQLTGGGQSRDVELTRYGAALLHLERKLSRRDDLLQAIRDGIRAPAALLEQHAVDSQLVVGKLAEIYRHTISTLSPRVMVSGDQGHLSRGDLADQIRALLLAGIRSAVLWRQVGGSRWRLLLWRNEALRAIEQLQLEAPPG